MSPISPASSPLEVAAILPAAGRGERAGTGDPKQFRSIAGVPMLLRALRPFTSHSRVSWIVIALAQEIIDHPPDWLEALAGDRVRLVPGGLTRTESVLEGLRSLPPTVGAVLIHDAARPFVDQATISAIIDRATAGCSAVAAVPLGDTLKRAEPHGSRVFETVPRQGLWRAQTPQGFPRQVLERAYEIWSANGRSLDATDDAALVEAAGFPVELVPDRSTNIKITTPDDFVLAESLATR